MPVPAQKAAVDSGQSSREKKAMGRTYQLEVPAGHPLAFQETIDDVGCEEQSLRHQLHARDMAGLSRSTDSNSSVSRIEQHSSLT